MRLAIIGATGVVGRELLSCLADSPLRSAELLLAASSKKKKRRVSFAQALYPVQSIEEVLQKAPDLAIFSAGASVSRAWAPRFVKAGSWVIDNSSAWRMDPNCPLVVPEVNAPRLPKGSRGAMLIANPNCATIQLVLALYPLHLHFGLQEVTLSTYQSVSGAGKAALEQLKAEESAQPPPALALGEAIYENLIPQIGALQAGHSEEERKIKQELRKILECPRLPVHVTCVRVPVLRGHSESIYIRTQKPIHVAAATAALARQSGLVVYEKGYPTPQKVAQSHLVHVGRLRQDEQDPQGLHLWVVADNLRKGAATNALQMAEHLSSTALKDRSG